MALDCHRELIRLMISSYALPFYTLGIWYVALFIFNP